MNIKRQKELDYLPSNINNVLICDEDIKRIVAVNYEKAIQDAENTIKFYESSRNIEAVRRTKFYKGYLDVLEKELNQIKI